jgi:late competence protein required for DNA uptake (superfamily II DNA/RNA helicase)
LHDALCGDGEIAVVSRTYRCLACLEGTVEREYDVSHIQVTCEACGEFGRFVHDGVYQQFKRFEESPPDDLDWDRLGRMEKFVVAEKMVREGKTVDDFEVESSGDDADS